jgi:hypothetical protein
MSLLGIECNHGFGDAVMCVPLIEAICRRENKQAVVYTKNLDAFANAPFIHDIIKSSGFQLGESTIRSKYDIDRFYQLTPQAYWDKFNEPGAISLLEMPYRIGQSYYDDLEFNRKMKIYLTEGEKNLKFDKHGRTVFIEAEHHSGQSWSIFGDFHDIIKNNPDCTFYWLSSRQPHFEFSNLKMLYKNYTRRECISLIRHADLFISVGSGIFCGCIGADISHVKTLMLWTDTVYKYIETISRERWFDDITWFADRRSWELFVKEFK